jgi:hypothetical protein
MKVFRMNVKRVGEHTPNRRDIVFVGAAEIADVNESAEIIIADFSDNPLHSLALLAEKSVIFGHGFNA